MLGNSCDQGGEAMSNATNKLRILMKFKTRSQLAQEYGISRKTLYNMLKSHNIELKPGQLSPNDQKKIIEKLGPPGCKH